MNTLNYDWNATAFFEKLTQENLLCQQKDYNFARCSGLDGLEEFIASMQKARQNCFSGVPPSSRRHDGSQRCDERAARDLPSVYESISVRKNTYRTRHPLLRPTCSIHRDFTLFRERMRLCLFSSRSEHNDRPRVSS